MDATQFAYWLQGYSEITQGQVPTPAQWQIIQDHLKLVFTKVTPDRSVDLSKELSDKIRKVAINAIEEQGRVGGLLHSCGDRVKIQDGNQTYCVSGSSELTKIDIYGVEGSALRPETELINVC